MNRRYLLTAAVLALAFPAVASAQLLFSANFNSAGDSANWTTNVAPTANSGLQSAEFGYDYSGFGIPMAPVNPAAPGPQDTFGLRLRANVPGGAATPVTTRPAGVTSGLSVSPTGQNFGAKYQVSFYAWSNFNGAPNAQGLADNANSEGGTNNVMFAVGTSGTVPLVVGNTTLVTNGQMDGIGFATTGDGGIVNDYRVYPKSGTIVPSGSPAYSGGATANTSAPYAALFPPVSAPAIQLTLSTAEYGSDASNTQGGSTQAGAFGFAWHYVQITYLGGFTTWDVDGTRLATFDSSALTMGGNNFALGQSDVNSSTTRHPSLLFSVFDNLAVTAVPEPGTLALAGLAVPALLRLRRRK